MEKVTINKLPPILIKMKKIMQEIHLFHNKQELKINQNPYNNTILTLAFLCCVSLLADKNFISETSEVFELLIIL
jgi:hypothetical protein